jgi:signal transduction histidine kinase
VLSVFCLAVLWEFWLEPAFVPGEFESESNADRWEFVWTSVTFAAIALIVPSLISLRNIAGRARAEVALRRAKDLAETANRAKSEFLAAMSHELRTPLNAIIGFSEIIQSETFGPVGSVKYRSYAEDINDSGQHLLALINDILDLSKVESGLDELYEEDIEVPAVIAAVLRLVRQRGEDGGLALDLDFPDDLPLLRGDERKLKQILANLLTNAIKFTDAGGKVTLRAWCRADSGFVFQIIDTGIGIAAEDIPKALSRFGQVDGDLNRQYEGTGLGLPLTKALVELHGGRFDLQSQVGVGTTATVRFPATRIIRSRHDTYAPGVGDRAVG